MTSSNNSDIDAFRKVYEALDPLDDSSRTRILTSVATMLGINIKSVGIAGGLESSESSKVEEKLIEKNIDNPKYQEFAELYADADPTSNAEKALVAGYWLQVCNGTENFSGHSVNSALNNLGHKLANVTVSLSSLIGMKPQLVLQLKKTGKSQQARKTYKLSMAGVDRVKEMISGQG